MTLRERTTEEKREFNLANHIAEVVFEHASYGSVTVSPDTTMSPEGFGKVPHTYPVTIVPSRYGGTYEGASWLCFPVSPGKLADSVWESWDDSDVECCEWWENAREQEWPIGFGSSPTDAYMDLMRTVVKRDGNWEFKEFFAEPTWDRDELKAQIDADTAL
jgi:hypothetical protein